jgi:elongation factor G
MKTKVINLGIFAHIDAGKTTFVERILYEAGELTSVGSVEDGTTEMDTLPEEISRGISITASTTQIRYRYKREQFFINIVDTPGHLDFHSQVDSALLAIDLAILLIDVTAGIRSQTEMIAEKLKQRNLPIIIFFNKIDKLREFNLLLKDIQKLFSKKVCPLFIPHLEEKFEFVFESKNIYEDLELPLIDWSDELTEKYFKVKDIKRLIINGIKQGLSTSAFIPALAGSALYGEGVKEFLHFVTYFEPKAVEREEKCIIFKKQIHPILGRIIYAKTFSQVHRGDLLFLANDCLPINKIFQIIPGGFLELEYVSSNNIFVIPVEENFLQIPDLKIGDILTGKPTLTRLGERQNFSREFTVIVEPLKEEHRELLKEGLEKLVWEDLGLSFSKRMDTGQWELRGMGELHLEVALKRLEFFIGEIFQIKNLRVAKYGLYKNVAKKVIFEHSTSDGKWKSGKISGFLEARTDFENKVYFESNLDLAVKSSIEAAFHEVLSHGWCGHPVLGVSLKVLSYEVPEVTNEHTLSLVKVSVISGLKALVQSNSKGIGPIARIEIIVPQVHFGSLVTLLNKRSVKVYSLEVLDGDRSLVRAVAPAEKLLGFQGSLRNMTQGKAQVSVDIAFSFTDYSEVSA